MDEDKKSPKEPKTKKLHDVQKEPEWLKLERELGIKQWEGVIVRFDDSPIYWCRLAAEEGDADAQLDLAECYRYGIFIGQDEKMAVYWYRKSGEGLNRFAQFKLADCYYRGIGVDKNDKQAFKWAMKAACQGLNRAMRFIGKCYMEGIGVEKDPIIAAKWRKVAAKNIDNSYEKYFDDRFK